VALSFQRRSEIVVGGFLFLYRREIRKFRSGETIIAPESTVTGYDGGGRAAALQYGMDFPFCPYVARAHYRAWKGPVRKNN